MRSRLLLVSLLGFVATIFTACDGNNLCIIGCGGGQSTTGPSATTTPTPGQSPSPSPSPSPFGAPSPAELPPCEPQTKPFVCLPGATTLGPILLAAQAEVPWAPEAIYVRNLVAKLNQDPRVCAIGGFPMPSDQIAIKYRSNSQSEDFDVVKDNGEIIAIPAGPSTPLGPANQCSPARF